ncbi:MAG: Na(+)/H(+) antiporter NhaA, partial [Alphaproteobacteria bacterium]
FYTADLSVLSLVLAGLALAALVLLNRLRVTRLAPYMLVGLLLWVFVLKSGVHATLAGVAIGFAIPLRARGAAGHSPLRHLEHMLHPWVAFAVLPLFAFANAGLPLGELSLGALVDPLPAGIALGLFLGKQLGVFGACALAVRLGLARLPERTSWAMLYGMAVLTGIGFTMSLFIGSLAFDGPAHANAIRLGILLGSLASAALGYGVLRRASRPIRPATVPSGR